MEDIPVEEDIPKNSHSSGEFPIDNSNNVKVSEVGEKIIEIVKLLIFSLTGYLFGTQANKKD